MHGDLIEYFLLVSFHLPVIDFKKESLSIFEMNKKKIDTVFLD